MGATFDSPAYFEKLAEAGMPEGQARIHAEALRQQADASRNRCAYAQVIRETINQYDAACHKGRYSCGARRNSGCPA